MDMTKTATKPDVFPKTDASRAFSEMADNGATQARETYETMAATTTQAADFIKVSSTAALKGMQDLSNTCFEFAHANTNAAFDFVHKLQGVKSPAEFMELSTQHARKQAETLTAQTKQLMEQAQKVAIATAEPLKTGVAKAFSRAA
jgi:phasin